MKRGNRTVGRPNFMGSIADFTNASKNRRGANALGNEFGKDGDAMRGAQNVQGLKQGGLQGVEDTIPYCAKEVRYNKFIQILFIVMLLHMQRIV